MPELIQTLNSFINEEDTLVVALSDTPTTQAESSSGFLPFKFYCLPWRVLKQQNLSSLISRLSHARKKPASYFIKQSQFLDVICCPDEFLLNSDLKTFLMSILEDVKCPIFIFSTSLKDQGHVYIRYSGTTESFESIRSFEYLFEKNLDPLKLHLLVKADPESLDHENSVYEFLKARGKNFSMTRYFNFSSLFELESQNPKDQKGIWVLGEMRNKVLELLSAQAPNNFSVFLL